MERKKKARKRRMSSDSAFRVHSWTMPTNTSNKNSTFRVAFNIDSFPYYFIDNVTGNIIGIFIDIWKTFGRHQGQTIEFVRRNNLGQQLVDGNYSGILGDIRVGLIDSTAELAYTQDRTLYFAMTVPAIFRKDEYIARRDAVDAVSLQHIIVFQPWIIVVMVALFTTGYIILRFIAVTAARIKSKVWPSRPFAEDFFQLNTVRVHSVSTFQIAASLLFAHTFTLFLYNTFYTGDTIVAKLDDKSLITMVNDLRNNGYRILIQGIGFLKANKAEELFGGPPPPSMLIVESNYALFDHDLCTMNKIYAKVNTDYFASYSPEELRAAPCNIKPVSHSLPTDLPIDAPVVVQSVKQDFFYAFALPPNRVKDKKALDFLLLTVYTPDLIRTRYWQKYTSRPYVMETPPTLPEFSVIALENVSIIFYAYFFGCSLALLVLLIEIGFERCWQRPSRARLLSIISY